MYNPIATYRLQFNKKFRFKQLEQIISYLKDLGIGSIYASPILESVGGSMHGYDLLSPSHIDPEIGTEYDFEQVSGLLQAKGIGWIQDIVPNHMAYHNGNHWLMDVLEQGTDSPYKDFFDMPSGDNYYDGKIMAPFLETTAEEAIRLQQLEIVYEHRRLSFACAGIRLPLQPWCYEAIFNTATQPQALKLLLERRPHPHSTDAYPATWDTFLDELSALYTYTDIAAYMQQCIRVVNKDPELLLFYVNAQHYRLCSWQETDKNINYRRFFTINSLIGLRQENQVVFDRTHDYISRLINRGLIKGLRTDHIDGLYDPSLYLQQLRELAGEDSYIIVEKILAHKEQLPKSWPVQGNTGYDFLSMVNELLVNKDSEKKLDNYYRELVQDDIPVATQISGKKKYILETYMAGELDNICRLFSGLIPEALQTVSEDMIRETMAAFLVYCPVYRYYADSIPMTQQDAAAIKSLIDTIKKERNELAPGLAILDITLLHLPHIAGPEYNKKALHFYRRCMQLTGPLMAKGVEDTLMYTHNRYIGQNEVGDHPEQFGMVVNTFHKNMIRRQLECPLSLNATATHDTKRGEDARARLSVLTDLPDLWIKQVTGWQHLNSAAKTNSYPDAADEYLIYQSLVAAYPMPGQEKESFEERFKNYLQKALREGKRHGAWGRPDEDYEAATLSFAEQLLAPGSEFGKSLETFVGSIADAGIIQSLVQLILKCSCPGIPDIYQGTELWDLSFVDPDNRRSVDFDWRSQLLADLDLLPGKNFRQHLWERRYDGSIKLWLLRLLLHLRQEEQELFTNGRYIPIQVSGQHKDQLLAFARRRHNTWLLVVVPVHLASLCATQQCTEQHLNWGDTSIQFPEEIAGSWQLQGYPDPATVFADGNNIGIQDLFRDWPFCIAINKQKDSGRRAGTLLPLSAVPSGFGIGDLGPGARQFVDFLYRTDQSYWQLLPLNPIDAAAAYSPYSTASGMASNVMLISPEGLADAGLISTSDLAAHQTDTRRDINYEAVFKAKNKLLSAAYNNFRHGSFVLLTTQFTAFCKREAYWLDDYACYTLLSQEYGHTQWQEWPEPYKNRNTEALFAFVRLHEESINKVKWCQFIFNLQWQELKAYAQRRTIQLFGDLPFYVSYGSVDVWLNPELFSLNPSGAIEGVAGVPPDYFSRDGQLWGMPTYNWSAHQADQYQWWIRRIGRNLELFDLLRIDHFRAFAAYWQVPATAATAREGRWIKGPGKAFFDVLLRHFGSLPFVAEDLGDDMEDTYALRASIGLPGMKVLQFAFGDNMPHAVDALHHHEVHSVVYTGTHDNNTAKGWFRSEAGLQGREQVRAYTGTTVKEGDIAQVLTRMAYSSVARIAIIPMQDLLGLGAATRMNTPGTVNGNWRWRLKAEQLTPALQQYIKNMIKTYDRR